MEDFDSRAIAGHLEFACRKRFKSSFQYPWERVLLADESPLAYLDIPKRIGHIPMVPVDSLPASSVSSCPGYESFGRKFVSKAPLIEWDQQLATHRAAGVRKWTKIILINPIAFEVSRSFFTSLNQGLSHGRFGETLENVFAGKSSSTLHTRASPMMRFVEFCHSKGLEPFPLREEIVYFYMQTEEQSCAPTYLRSFVASVAFSWYVIGLSGADKVIVASRGRGIATKVFLRKRKTRSRLPLKMEEILTLENVVNGKLCDDLQDRHAAGCFLFMIYAMARFSDMMNVTKLDCEFVTVRGKKLGFIETTVGRSKTSFSAERKVRFLPMTATINGLGPEPWGPIWMDVIEQNGLTIGAGKPLLPARSSTGWHSLPLSAEAASSWLRTLLKAHPSFDRSRESQIGTHSCKATLLSWLAKYGCDAETRKLMGYHVHDKMSTMLIYGRDNTSAGLRKIQEVIDEVVDGAFMPDATRSGMFRLASNDESADDRNSSPKVHQPDLDTSSSSEDSADEDSPEHDAGERAEQLLMGDWSAGVDVSKLPELSEFYRHKISRFIHLSDEEDHPKLMCGRDINASYLQLGARPRSLHPLCKQCFGRFAANTP